jgi:hypothetical protein
MTTKVQDSALSESPIPHERKIAVAAWGAWICVCTGLLVAVPGVWLFWHEVHRGASQVSPLGNLSSLGSYLQGAVQSLWSLAAFLFIYVAFLGQKQQLIIQNEQLKAQKKQFEEEQEAQKQLFRQQREQMEAQRKQFEAQEQSIKRQNFENSFFQLLRLHSQLVSNIRATHPQGVNKALGVHVSLGGGCFEELYRFFKQTNWGIDTKKKPDGNVTITRKPEGERYAAFYVHFQEVLGHYFRTLYHVIKFVKNSDVEDKRRYTSLVRATLSQFELALLFYNCVSPLGEEKFKPLVEEFGLLESLNLELLLKPEDEKLYDPKAFQ